MSEEQAEYGRTIKIDIQDMQLFRDCPRCAYFKYHPNIEVSRPGEGDKQPNDLMILSSVVEIFTSNLSKKPEAVRVELWGMSGKDDSERMLEVVSDAFQYAIGVLKQRDFPLADENCEYCKYYDELFDKIA